MKLSNRYRVDNRQDGDVFANRPLLEKIHTLSGVGLEEPIHCFVLSLCAGLCQGKFSGSQSTSNRISRFRTWAVWLIRIIQDRVVRPISYSNLFANYFYCEMVTMRDSLILIIRIVMCLRWNTLDDRIVRPKCLTEQHLDYLIFPRKPNEFIENWSGEQDAFSDRHRITVDDITQTFVHIHVLDLHQHPFRSTFVSSNDCLL